jgi:hypothetical protein
MHPANALRMMLLVRLFSMDRGEINEEAAFGKEIMGVAAHEACLRLWKIGRAPRDSAPNDSAARKARFGR